MIGPGGEAKRRLPGGERLRTTEPWGSFDAVPGRLDAPNGRFTFSKRHFKPVILNPATGAVVSG